MNNNFREDYQGYRDFLMHSTPYLNRPDMGVAGRPEKVAKDLVNQLGVDGALRFLSEQSHVPGAQNGETIDMTNQVINIILRRYKSPMMNKRNDQRGENKRGR